MSEAVSNSLTRRLVVLSVLSPSCAWPTISCTSRSESLAPLTLMSPRESAVLVRSNSFCAVDIATAKFRLTKAARWSNSARCCHNLSPPSMSTSTRAAAPNHKPRRRSRAFSCRSLSSRFRLNSMNSRSTLGKSSARSANQFCPSARARPQSNASFFESSGAACHWRRSRSSPLRQVRNSRSALDPLL